MPPSYNLPALFAPGLTFLNLGRVSTGNGPEPLPEAGFILSRANFASRFDKALPLSGRLLHRCFRHASSIRQTQITWVHPIR